MFVIQIGAADGKHDYHRGVDEVWELVTKKNWKCYLIEPNPETFGKLLDNYSTLTRPLGDILMMQCAVANYNGKSDFYVTPDAPEASTLLFTILDKKDYHNGTTKKTEKITIQCKRLQSIIEEQHLPLPDYLVIDAEGCDGDIIEDLDLDKYPIPRIRFEFSHIEDAQLGRVCLKLIKHEYVLSHDKADIIAKKDI